MSFPRYAEYKPSGVEWLGEVPAHWEVSPCRAFVTERSTKNEDAANQNYLSLMANVGIIPYEEKGDVGNKKPEDLSKCKLVEVGDFVINSMNYGIGSYGLSPFKGVCSSVYIVLTPKLSVVDPRYAHRIFEDRAFQGQAQSFGNGILEHRAAINWDILKGMRVALPPLNEQKMLLAFLDRETGKIDALVAEQQKLIALLKEKRQAVISHAVTKGLNPHAPMKPSGIEWLGDVPAHWDVSPLKHVVAQGTSVSYGIVQPGEPLEAGVPFVQTTNMSSGNFSFELLQRTTAEIASQYPRSRLDGGEVLLGIRASIGAAHVVPDWLRGANLSRGIARIVPSSNTAADYLVAYLRTLAVEQYWQLSKQGSTFNEVSIETVRELPVVVPPLLEQQQIANYVLSEARRFDDLQSEGSTAITLLKERRSALISAAVTGQIDVHGLTFTASAESPAGAVL